MSLKCWLRGSAVYNAICGPRTLICRLALRKLRPTICIFELSILCEQSRIY